MDLWRYLFFIFIGLSFSSVAIALPPPNLIDVGNHCGEIVGEADSIKHNFWAKHGDRPLLPRSLKRMRRKLIHYIRYMNQKPFGIVALEDGSAEFIGVFLEPARFVKSEVVGKAGDLESTIRAAEDKIRVWMKAYRLYPQNMNQIMDQIAVYSQQLIVLGDLLHGSTFPAVVSSFPTTVAKDGRVVYKSVTLVNPMRVREKIAEVKRLRRGMMGTMFGPGKLYEMQLNQVRLEWRLKILQEQLYIKIYETRDGDRRQKFTEVKAEVDKLLAAAELRPSARVKNQILNREILNDLRSTMVSIRQSQYAEFIQKTVDTLPMEYKKRMGIDQDSLKKRFSFKKRFFALLASGGGGLLSFAALVPGSNQPAAPVDTFKTDVLNCVELLDDRQYKDCLYEVFRKHVNTSEAFEGTDINKLTPSQVKQAYFDYFAKNYTKELQEIHALRKDHLLEQEYYLALERAIDEALMIEVKKEQEQQEAEKHAETDG